MKEIVIIESEKNTNKGEVLVDSIRKEHQQRRSIS